MMGKRFDPAHMERLLGEERRKVNDPVQILAHLNLQPGMTLADVGCGPGWFAVEAGKQVTPGGLIYGIDLSEAMLERLAQRAAEAGVTTVKPILGEEPDEWPVPTESCDAVLLANVYHETDPQSLFLGEVKRMMKPGGLCLLVDWKPEPTPGGPPLAERLNPDEVAAEFTAAGFQFQGHREVGPYHYGLLFQKIGA